MPSPILYCKNRRMQELANKVLSDPDFSALYKTKNDAWEKVAHALAEATSLKDLPMDVKVTVRSVLRKSASRAEISALS